uniref:Kinesin motor domain-containing protein n=1 Tax=Macrostomum lignano TaxID=282301 RepID=A0A1I8IFG5_9PLAT
MQSPTSPMPGGRGQRKQRTANRGFGCGAAASSATRFAELLRTAGGPPPPPLLPPAAPEPAASCTSAAKMKVIVKVVSKETGGAACMSADSRRRQPELCSAALPEIIQGVVSGSDGCVFVFGYGGLGES